MTKRTRDRLIIGTAAVLEGAFMWWQREWLLQVPQTVYTFLTANFGVTQGF